MACVRGTPRFYRCARSGKPQPTSDSRAKLAPARPRIELSQAVNSGFAAPSILSDHPAEFRSTMRKTAQESQESRRGQKTRFFGAWVFETAAFNRSATPPGGPSSKASACPLLEEGPLALAHLGERRGIFQILGCDQSPAVARTQLRDHRDHARFDAAHERVLGRGDEMPQRVGRGAARRAAALDPL